MEEFVSDVVGNKVHVGDEVFYHPYKSSWTNDFIQKVEKLSKNAVYIKGRWNYSGKPVRCERFIKVIREEANEKV